MGLLGLIYSEFDNEVGPRLLYQYPEGILSPKTFETLSDFIIVGKHLCEKIMIVKHDSLQIVNYSVAIENSKYGRNTLSFAPGFVLDEDTETEPYEIALRKFASTLIALELESEYLFCPSSKEMMGYVLKSIYDGFISSGEAFIQFDSANLLALKLSRQLHEPPPLVHDYDVPILLYDKSLFENIPWDITVQRLLPHMNGRSCTRKISFEAECSFCQVDLQCVKRCLRVLLFYKLIILSDIFSFSNVYCTTPLLLELANPKQFTEIESFCALSPGPSSLRKNIFRFLLSLKPGVPISSLIASTPCLVRGVDIIRLLGVAQHLGLIRRVRRYPVLKRDHPIQLRVMQTGTGERERERDISLSKSLVGLSKKTTDKHSIHKSLSQSPSHANSSVQSLRPSTSCGPSTEEICCVMEITQGELEESSCSFVWK